MRRLMRSVPRPVSPGECEGGATELTVIFVMVVDGERKEMEW